MITTTPSPVTFKGLVTALFIFFLLSIPGRNYGQVTLPANFSDGLVMGGWTNVEGFRFDAQGRMFVWEKAGKVWIVDTNNVKRPSPLIDISEEVGDWRDHGLNGFALDPNFNVNGYFYLMYTVDRHYLLKFGTGQYNAATNEYYNATIIRVTRYKADAATNFVTTVPNSRLVLIGETKKTGIPLLHESHSGGSLVFGTDGSLLISTGDGASYNLVDAGSSNDTYWSQGLADTIIRTKENVGAFRAQLVDCLNGKILRIDPATGNGLPTNPWYDAANPRAAKSRVWSLGLRNPFRMILKPGTGNTDITAGDPGVLYIGDVQWSTWEDLNTATGPGKNFGWPVFEGLTLQSQGYQTSTAQNMDAPNPLYGGSCTQQYFRFTQLINQDTIGTPAWKNPCNVNQVIPASIPKFIHTRPAVDWAHGNQSRTGIFNGTSAAVVNIYSGSSPVPGPQFGGNASVGGVWYTGNKYPVQYQNKYFHADYGGAWIKMFDFNSSNQPLSVSNFAANLGAVVYVGMNPRTSELYYIKYSDQIRKITYSLSVNNPPTAVASQNILYGAGPLPVNFTGSNSTDPENMPLSYSWNFGDGGTSTAANPSHTFTAPAGVPTNYTVTLTVTDNASQTSVTTLHVYVNNTPPQVTITSFSNGALFSVAGPSILPLQATVTDLEHAPGQLFYSWITVLHHNNHYHPETPDTNKITTTVLSPPNCDDSLNVYSYDIRLTVTDAGGLSTTVQQTVYPACAAPVAAFSVNDASLCIGQTVQYTDQSSSLPDTYTWSFPGGTPSSSTQKNPSVTYSTAGTYNVSLTVANIRGNNTLVKSGYIAVNAPPVVNAGTYPAACTNSPLVTLSGTPAGGTFSGTGVNSGSFNPSTGAGTYTITYNYTDANGCSNSANTSITVNNIPTVNAGTYSAVCANGNQVSLSGTPAGGTFSGTGVTGNSFNPAVSGAGTFAITYSYTNANGCTNTASTNIVVNDLTPVNAGTYTAVCLNGNSVSLSGTPVGGTFSGTGVTGNSFSPVVSGAGTFAITYSYTNANGCTNSASTNIVVNNLSAVDAGTYTAVCANGNAVSLSGTPAGGTFSGTGVTGNSFDPAVSGAGTFAITYSYTNANGCTNSASTNIAVNNLSAVDAGTYTAVCVNGNAVSLSGTPSGGTFSGTGVTGNSFDPAVSGAGIFAITYSYTNANGCTNSASTNIIVNDLPLVDAGTYTAVCVNGNPISLSGTPAGGTFSGTGVTGNSFSPAVSGAGTFAITYFYTNANGCTNSASTNIAVNNLSAVDAGTYTAVCVNGNPISLSGTPVGGTFSGTGVTGNSFDPAVSGAGTFAITYIYTNGSGCSAGASTNIVVNNLPSVNAGSYIPVCQNGGLVNLSGTPAGGTFTGNGVTANSFNPATGPGSYILTYTYSDVNGCTNADTALIVVNNCNCAVPAQPGGITVSGGISKVCPGDSRSYSVLLKPNVTYNWITPPGAVIQSGQGTNIVVVNFNAGFSSATATLSVTANNNCGASPARSTTITRNNPVIPSTVTGPSWGVCNSANVAYSISSIAGVTYNWTFNTSLANVLTGQGTSSITAEYLTGYINGNLSVQATNACGTSAVRVKTVKAAPEPPTPVTGNAAPCMNQQGVAYSVPVVSSATKYLWAGPSGSHLSNGITTGGASLVTTSNNVIVNYGATATRITCNAGNACGYGSQAVLNIAFSCREAKEESSLPDKNKVSIYPNPAKGKAMLEFYSERDEHHIIRIIDVLGKIKFEKEIETVNGLNTVALDLSGYPNGIYLLEVSNNLQQHYAKIIVE